MLYAKSLRITSGVKAELGVGAIVNLQSNDGSKIWNLPQYLHIVWNGPFQVWTGGGSSHSTCGFSCSWTCPYHHPPTHTSSVCMFISFLRTSLLSIHSHTPSHTCRSSS